MNDLQQQLMALRERVARVNARYAERSEPHKQGASSNEGERPLAGELIKTEAGCHWEREVHYAGHKRHGSADIGALSDLPHDVLDAISEGKAPATDPAEWAFLDIESTGFAGSMDTCAFLIGVGRITPKGFRIRQFFMRDDEEEASVLAALAQHLASFRVLVTYNGRTFDQPLLEARYRAFGLRAPFANLTHHADLLHGSRRLWKLRYESCRLVDLERQVLGFERVGDVPGSMMPYYYFEYQQNRDLNYLRWVFEHNALDILSLACLMGIVPQAFRKGGAPKHGSEMLGVARWVLKTGNEEEARTLMQRAVAAGLPDRLLFRTLWDIAALDRKLGAEEQALAAWMDLAGCKNPFRVRALEELAKSEEHRGKNPAKALEFVRAALEWEDTPELRRREERLLRRVGRASVG